MRIRKAYQLVEDHETEVAVSQRAEPSMTTKADCTIVTLLGAYLPGYKAGGPIRSVANMVVALGEELSFKIITMDRDMGDPVPYPGVEIGRWIPVGNADVMYLSSGWKGLFRLMALLNSLDTGSVLYLNSFFSRRFSMLAIFMRWMGICKPKCIVLAPRGGTVPQEQEETLLYEVVQLALPLSRDHLARVHRAGRSRHTPRDVGHFLRQCRSASARRFENMREQEDGNNCDCEGPTTHVRAQRGNETA